MELQGDTIATTQIIGTILSPFTYPKPLPFDSLHKPNLCSTNACLLFHDILAIKFTTTLFYLYCLAELRCCLHFPDGASAPHPRERFNPPIAFRAAYRSTNPTSEKTWFFPLHQAFGSPLFVGKERTTFHWGWDQYR